MSQLTNLVAPLARGVLTWMGRRRLPLTSGSLQLPGLEAQVEVLRDRWGVPHIYAQNTHDLFLAQGFVHAQDRLFQLELNRRTALGRLSELFGPLALDTDRAVRTFGFARLGRQDWADAAEDLRQAILAYTQGINAFLEHPSSKLPIEFTLLNHRPEPWQPEHTAAFGRVMMWQLSHAWHGEIVRLALRQAVGDGPASEWEIQYPSANPATLPFGVESNPLGLSGSLQPGGPFLQRGLGSNAWVISAERSASGSPYLCNDMHLTLSQPGLWYEIHLCGGGINVTGVSLPGAPMVLVGHNEHIAWGSTLAYTDCEDLFIEHFSDADPEMYEYQGQQVKAEVIREEIRVKGQAQPVVEPVVITRHGPVISGVVWGQKERLAVCSKALQPSPTLQGYLRLNQAKDWESFKDAMRLIEAPQLNMAYADVQGNIGYWVTGRTPIRLKGDGSVPAPGWTGEYEWSGEIPFEEMPHALNPRQGYLVTSNHKIVGDDYPYFLGNVWMNGYRARRLSDLIESREKLAPQDFHAMHVDFTCLPGREFVSALAGFSSADPQVERLLELLRAWDGVLSPESVGGTVYEVARFHLVEQLLGSALSQEMALRVVGMGFNPVLMATQEFYGQDTLALLRILNNPDSWWLQRAGGRETLLEKGLKSAAAWLNDLLGPDPAAWQWGRIHRAVFPHPMGLVQPLDKVFNRGPAPIGGDTDTPCQTAMLPHDPYDNRAWAPSFRQIVDMGDLSRSEVISPPGASGQLGSPHYDDWIEPWLKGEYHPMLWTREQVEREIEARLVLEKQ